MYLLTLILDKFDKITIILNMEKVYYLDNASTTRVFPEIFDLMKSNNAQSFFNPSAAYSAGLASKKVLDKCRAEISAAMSGKGGRLVFVSSATEANNTVARGVHLRAGQTVLVSAGEHPSVYEPMHLLERQGIVVKDIPLCSDGTTDSKALAAMLDESVKLVSVMHVSNETGAVNDIAALCKMVKQYNPKILFHSDGVQAFGKIEVNLMQLGVDFYTVSAHKVYAPRGIAALWIKSGATIEPLLLGGGQEDNLRSSTENLDAALGFCYAINKVIPHLNENYEIVKKRKNDLIDAIKHTQIAEFIKFFDFENTSPYILEMSVSGIKAEVFVRILEGFGVIVSTGSACSSKKAGNRTLEAIGKTKDEVLSSIRVSFSPYEDFDCKAAVDAITICVKKLRFMD